MFLIMKKSESEALAKGIGGLLSLALLGWFFFTTMSPSVKGTYKWDYNGHEQTIVISTRGDSGPCIWRGENGNQTHESFDYYTYHDRPMLYINGMAYIDVKNRMVYSSESDFKAYRNGTPCRITR